MRFAALAMFFATALFAGPTATLTGRVTDPTGSAIPKVDVQAVNVETGAKTGTETNDEGLYRFPSLPPGVYRLVLEKHGFKVIVKPGIELRVQDVFAVNFEMQIGSVSESITVEEGAPLIQAETAMVGQVIDRRLMTELPSATRNPYDFMALVPGAGTALGSNGRGVGYVVNGQRSESGAYLLDGSDNTDTVTSNPGQILPNDAILEYRVLTNSFTAEYGRNLGFVADLVTRTGSNDLHGSLYDYARNSALAANRFDNNALGRAAPVFNRHQPGGSIGGPAIKDRAFYFGSFESIVVRSIGPSNSYYVPTPQLLAISSPATQALFLPYAIPSGLSALDVLTRTLTPAGGGAPVTIPAFAAVSRRGPLDVGAGSPQNTYLATGRLDYVLSSRTTLSARYSYQRSDEFATVSQPYSADLDRSALTQNQNATINLTRVWSGSMVGESRAVFGRVSIRNSQAGPDAAFRALTINGESQVTLPAAKDASDGPRNSFQLYQNINWVRGSHSLKLGAQALQHRSSRDIPIGAQGVRPVFAGAQGLVDGKFVNVRVGIDFQANRAKPGDPIRMPVLPPNDRQHTDFTDGAWFVQDTWKLSHRLTLTPGLRWELNGLRHSAGAEAAYDVNYYPGPGSNYFERFANGSFLTPDQAPEPYRGSLVRPHHNQYGPRLGFAYDLTGDGRTVFRAGGGVYFENRFGEARPRVTGGVSFPNVSLTTAMLANPYDFGGQAPYAAPQITRVDPDLGSMHGYAWNATLDREVSRSIVLSASYIGSSDAGLPVSRGENEVGSGRFLGRPSERLNPAYGGFGTFASIAHSSYHGLQLKAESASIRRVGVQFGANYSWSHSIDNASAADNEATGTSQGVMVDPYNPRRDRADSTFDVRHKFAAYFVWQVPALHAGPALLRRLARGWQASGILTFQSGQPFEVLDTGATGREGTLQPRPRVTGALPQPYHGDQLASDPIVPDQFYYLRVNAVRQGSTGPCIVAAAPFACLPSVVQPPDDILPRDIFRRPGRMSQNLTAARTFRVRERVSLQLRGEFYNAFNHANLAISTTSGAVDLANQTFLTKPYILATRTSTPRQIVMAARIQF